MAFRLDKNTDRRLDALQQSLTETRTAVEEAVAKYNETVDQARGLVETELSAYNEIVEETRGVIEDFQSEMQSEWDDKSERWQEGERGQEVQDWINELESVQSEFETVELPEVEDLDLNLPDHPDVIDQLERECPAS